MYSTNFNMDIDDFIFLDTSSEVNLKIYDIYTSLLEADIDNVFRLIFNLGDTYLTDICKFTFLNVQINGPNGIKYTGCLLSLLAIKQRWDIIKHILSNNINFSLLHNKISRILFDACEYGQINILEICFNKGIDISQLRNINKETLLHHAACCGQINIVKYLLETERFDINDNQNSKEHTPLYKAFRKFHIEIVKMLIDNGADVNTVFNLSIECKYYHYFGDDNKYIEMIKLFINSKKLEIDIKTPLTSPLINIIHLYKSFVNKDDLDNVFRSLVLLHKTDILRIKDEYGITIYSIAKNNKCESIVKILQEEYGIRE